MAVIMKRNFILLAIVSLITFSSCFNGTNAPSLVKKKFNELYPKTNNVEWVENSNSSFTATFSQDNKTIMASFSKYGIWLDTKYAIPESDVPAISVAYIKQFYPADSIKEMYAVKNPDGDFFEINVQKDTLLFSVMFDKEGKLFRDDNNVLLRNFKKMFSNPSDVKWVRAGDDRFDVFFKDNGKACKVSFTINGDWIETQTLASETEVPEGAFTYLKKNYKAFELKGIIFVKSNDSEFFNIVILHKEQELNLYFDIEGNFIKKGEAAL
jgi:hypothetical protein